MGPTTARATAAGPSRSRASSAGAKEGGAGRLRTVLIEDHALVRHAIRSVLESMADVEVVGEAAEASGGLELIAAEAPDVAIVDLSLPGTGGVEVTRRIAGEHPDTAVVVLSVHTDEGTVQAALEAGARAYVAKECDASALRQALSAARRGKRYLSPGVDNLVVRSVTSGEGEGRRHRPPADSPLDVLTPRQREVLRLVAAGFTSPEISERLDISDRTVEAHRRHIRERLGIDDVPGLVKFAIRAGLLDEE